MKKIIFISFTSLILVLLIITMCNSKIFNDDIGVSKIDIKSIVEYLGSDELKGRYVGTYENQKAAEYISDLYKLIGLKSFNDSYYMPYDQWFLNDDFTDRYEKINNVVGYIEGENKDNIIVISAHFDHIGIGEKVDDNGTKKGATSYGFKEGEIANGYIDNASGVSSMLYIANKLQNYFTDLNKKPDNSILFCAFNGEEVGLSGSWAFAQEMNNKYNIIYNLNIDSIGYKATTGLWFYENEAALECQKKLENKVQESLEKNNFDYVTSTNIAGVSDNLSFGRLNIPNALIVDEGVKNVINKVGESLDMVDFDRIENISLVLCDFILSDMGLQ